MKVLLAVLPYFQNSSFLVAHLGNACISAYLKEKISEIKINTIDLRTEPEVEEIWSAKYLREITFKTNFVSDIYDLSIIAWVISQYNKYKSMRHILEPNQEIVYNWSKERDINYQTITNVLKKTNSFALKQVKKFEGYDIVGFSLYTTNLYLSVFMAILIKLNYPRTKIVFGGPQITQGETTREMLIKGNIADYLVLGEGEEPMYQLIKALENNESIDNIIGIKTKSNFDQIDTFSTTADLESLPTPNYDGTDFSAFNPFVIPVYSNRGCPFRCHFCSEHSLFGKKFKRRSPMRVVEDMKELSHRYKLNFFTIADSLINSSNEWLEEFTEILLNTKEKFYWGGYFRAQLKEDLVKKMKEVGLVSAILGVESFSQKTLDNMNKKKESDEIIDTIHYLVENDISAFVNLFVGYPDEKESDFLSTYNVSNLLYEEFRKKNKSEFFRITARSFQMRPFSNVYNSYEKFGLSAKSWSEYYSDEFFIPELKNVFDKTLCTFKVNNVSLEDTWHRILRMKEIREKTVKNT
ncbi:MAG: radical SAM protein [Candidatus Sericytochromatia bacterium]